MLGFVGSAGKCPAAVQSSSKFNGNDAAFIPRLWEGKSTGAFGRAPETSRHFCLQKDWPPERGEAA